ncbi:MAG TPA: hypothetical protein DIW30_06195 [Bacteroidales bacterium]|nr:hypothetical protein [Bacteroidales bacterium]
MFRSNFIISMKRTIYFLGILFAVTILLSAGKKPLLLYMVGDSTMADRADTTITPERGWGQVLPTFLDEGVVVKNYAMNGRSTRSFIEEGRWKEVVSQLHRGDVVIIQFGHNDTKQSDKRRYTSIEDYQTNLSKMVQEARKKGAKPILCTPIARRYFSKETGELVNRHGGYVEAARQVAKAEKVPLLDMNEMTSEWLRREGDSASIRYFCHMPAGVYKKYPEGKKDNTHLSEAGAIEVARMAAEDIKNQNIKGLGNHVVLSREGILYTSPVAPLQSGK